MAIVAATFFFLLPKIADYRDVWDVVQTLSWEWLLVFAGVVVLNLATYAPPWLVVLPKLRFFQAMELTQASTALSLVLPAGTAAGLGVSFGMLQTWGLPGARSRAG